MLLFIFSSSIFPQEYEAPNQRFIPDSLLHKLEKVTLLTDGLIQVTHFQQCNQNWSENILGTCASTICSEGCALTSAAMLLRTIGTDADPGKLNEYLINNNGYVSGCLIIWDVAAHYPGSTMQWYAMTDYNLTTVKSEIDAGNPVIIKVTLPNSNHFMVIRGYNGMGTTAADFIVLDPRFTYETNLSEYTIGSNPALRLFRNLSLPVSLEAENPHELNNHFQLNQNYPNPFNCKTIIHYSIFDTEGELSTSAGKLPSLVQLLAYDILGNKVGVLVNQFQSSGNYKVEFDGTNLSSGVYYCRLQTRNYFETIKIILQK